MTFTPEQALGWTGSSFPRRKGAGDDGYEAVRKALRWVKRLEERGLVESLEPPHSLFKVRLRNELGRGHPYIHPARARDASFPLPDDFFKNGWIAALDGAQIVVLLAALERSTTNRAASASLDVQEFFVTKEGAQQTIGLTHKRFREAAIALEAHGLLIRRRVRVEERGERLADATARRREVWRLASGSLSAQPTQLVVTDARTRRRERNAAHKAATRLTPRDSA